MRHNRKDKMARGDAFRKFLKANPPKMPKEFSNAEYKRVVSYARAAFGCGFFTAMNYMRREFE